jgi:hypothetical protein
MEMKTSFGRAEHAVHNVVLAPDNGPLDTCHEVLLFSIWLRADLVTTV